MFLPPSRSNPYFEVYSRLAPKQSGGFRDFHPSVSAPPAIAMLFKILSDIEAASPTAPSKQRVADDLIARAEAAAGSDPPAKWASRTFAEWVRKNVPKDLLFDSSVVV